MEDVVKYRSRQMAKRYNISVSQVIDWFHEGVLPGIQVNKLILFDPIECDHALETYRRLKGGKVVK
jgi:hypothetical protein